MRDGSNISEESREKKNKGKELEGDSHEFPSFNEMISDAGTALFPGNIPFSV